MQTLEPLAAESRSMGRRLDAPEIAEELSPELEFLKNLKAGDEIGSAIVVRKLKVGVLVDIGSGTFAVLKGPREELLKLRFGETLSDLQVYSVDFARRRVDVFFPGLSELVADRELKRIRDLEEGELMDGWVTSISYAGVFVDIGAEVIAKVKGAKDQVFKLELNEHLKGLRVEWADVAKKHIAVSFPDLEKHVADRGLLIKDVKEGDIIDGKVAKRGKGSANVYVTLGGPGCLAELIGNRKQLEMLRPNEPLPRLEVVMVDRDKQKIRVCFPGLSSLVKDRDQVITTLRVGDRVNGIVSRKTHTGVFVEIDGTDCRSLLLGGRWLSKLKPGTLLKDLTVEKIDRENSCIEVSVASTW